MQAKALHYNQRNALTLRRSAAHSLRIQPSSASSACPYRVAGPARGGVACSSSNNDNGPNAGGEQKGDTGVLLAMGALVLAGAVTVGLSNPAVEDAVEDLIYNTDMMSGAGFGPADALAGFLWGVSLFYASPLQQLLLFLGKIETQRPSDWIILGLARGPLGMPITDVNEAPGWLSGVAAGVCLMSGLVISAVMQAGLGDSIWALSTGTGACLAAGVYEVGRPKRMNRAEAQELDDQWRDFVGWANGRLVRSGRCHESEIQAAFRKQFPRYRSQDALPDATFRSLVRNWAPDVDRTPNGYYRGVSLRPRVNEFTGQVEGGSGAASPVVASRDPSPTASVEGEGEPSAAAAVSVAGMAAGGAVQQS